MSKYIVLTTLDTPDFAIEADNFWRNRDSVYVFEDEDGDTIAEIPINPNILGVVEEDSLLEEVPEDIPEDNPDDVCLDCRFKEFLDSPEFFDKVDDIVSFWHKPNPDESPAEPPAPKGVDNLTVYRAQNEQGRFFWGFNTPDGQFVPWREEYGSPRKGAEDGLKNYLSGVRGFYMIPVSDVTPIPEETK